MNTENLIKEPIRDKTIRGDYYGLIDGDLDVAIQYLNYVKSTYKDKYEKIVIEITSDEWDAEAINVSFHGYRKLNEEDLAKQEKYKKDCLEYELKQLQTLAAKHGKTIV